MIHEILKILDTTDLEELEKQRITTDLLRLFNVVGRSEQLLCGDLIKHNFSLSKIGICYECKFIKDRAN